MKLWHCRGSRSIRPLWALEEMELEYEVEVLPFPPRIYHREYIETNSLGTVPYFVDGDARMTESSGICLYLVEKYQRYDLGLKPDHPEYADYLNWLFHSDATLTFPQTIAMRYLHLDPDESKKPVALDYAKWFYSRLRFLDKHLLDRDFLVDKRFTIADITVGYALYLAVVMRLGEFAGREFTPQVQDYYARLTERGAFLIADSLEETKFPATG
jgi:glutathione S-transferase